MCLVNNEELIENGIYLDDFQYDDLHPDLVDIYSSYEEKFKTLFKNYAEIHRLEKCYFFIKNSNNCNACASNRKGYNIIGITNGFPILMKNKFKHDFFDKIFLIGLINEKSISDAYCALYEDPNFEINDFMLDCSINFTFHHEFRHILQFNSSRSDRNYSYSENLDRRAFDINRHAWEFDADRIASFNVIKHVFSVYRQLHSKNDEKLKCLLYLGLASIVITKNLFYFNVMNDVGNKAPLRAQGFYTEKYSHPHPLVRTINIFNYFNDCVKDDFPRLEIQLQQTLNNVLAINKLYFDSLRDSSDVTRLFCGELKAFLDDIHVYNDKLYDVAINNESIKLLLSSSGVKVSA